MSIFSREEKYMARAIDIARRGEGMVSPNPLVGAVIVYNNKIIAEGWHEKYGEAHAEVNAINQLSDELLKKSEIFVSLEPCSHYGKTPPCADLIISKQIPKVFISIKDPNPLVSGSGIKKLEQAGIDIQSGILKKEGEWLNRRFLINILKQRPYVILKWAQSKDGFVAGENGRTVKISNEISQVHSHKLRAREDAILVGAQTVINDNPRLNTRHYKGKNPLRVTFDFENSLPLDSTIFNQEAKTIVFNYSKEKISENVTWLRLEPNKELIPQILNHLYKLNIGSLIVEGGTKTLNLFIESGIYDEIHVFEGDLRIKKGIIAPDINLDSASSKKILKKDCYYFFKIN
ncbi:MAG: bifunctional diaminohydroxyphosphoribosylaminopyrimidine deaminase/5-amino-6-(5-phosphoribosylamino)uracil reductase RibD [Cytophagales bacterium]